MARYKIIGFEPIVADEHGIYRQRAYVGDKMREIPGNLRVGRLVVLDGGRDRLHFAELIDFDDVGCDAALRRLPDQTGGLAEREYQATKSHEPPILRLHARGANALIPKLSCPLIGGDGLRCAAVTLKGASKEHGYYFS